VELSVADNTANFRSLIGGTTVHHKTDAVSDVELVAHCHHRLRGHDKVVEPHSQVEANINLTEVGEQCQVPGILVVCGL